MATLKEVAQVAVEARRDKGSGSGKRLREIERILRQHRVLSGLTPEKATSLLEDLGPTFVKMGQIAANRSDVIPPAYADAFKRLRADVPPMPFSTVLATIEESLGHPWRETFSCIEEKPLGSASIAQVHRARIAPHAVGDAGAGTGAAAVPLPADAPKAGSYMAIKVRRPHVVEQMTQDLALIRQAVALVGLTRATDGIKLSLDDLVTELERTTRQELDFCVEQHNLVRFRQFLDDQPGVESPRPYPHLSSDDVLVMDFVEGPMINDVPALRAMGLDPAKLGQRLAESFVTQIVDNGFFHADPHPGNLLVRSGKIVYIDLGIMGRLSPRDRAGFGNIIQAVGMESSSELKDALLSFAIAKDNSVIDHTRFLADLDLLLNDYGSCDVADIDIGAFLNDILMLTRSCKVTLPSSITSVSRGIVTLEGTIAPFIPNQNVVSIINAHIQRSKNQGDELVQAMQDLALALRSSSHGALDAARYSGETLKMLTRGQLKMNMEVLGSEAPLSKLAKIINRLTIGIIIAGLFIGSSMLSLSSMEPRLLGVPVLAFFGYLGAAVLSIWVIFDIGKRKL